MKRLALPRRILTRGIAIAVALLTSAGGVFAADPWTDLVNVQAQLAREMSRIDTVLAYQDLSERVALLFGQGTVAESDARMRAIGDWFLRRQVSEADLAEARNRADAAISAYLNAASQAVASSTAWPGGAGQQAEAQRLLDAVRSSYPRFLQRNLDPTLLVMQAAIVVGWSRGEAQVANPFAGHFSRMGQAYSDPRTRARIAAASAPLVALDGATAMGATPYSPPPPRQTADNSTRQQRPPAPPPLPPPVGNDHGAVAETTTIFDQMKYSAEELRQAGMQIDTDLPGMDLETISIGDPDPVLCMTECQDYGGCRAFVYIKPTNGLSARCVLKSGIPSAVRSSCCIAGTP